MIPEDEVRRAIAVVESSRQTHVAWADFLRSGEEFEPTADNIGDVDHHERCIADYDHVLSVLRRIGGRS